MNNLRYCFILLWFIAIHTGCSLLDRQVAPEIQDIRIGQGDSLSVSIGRGKKVEITLVTQDKDNDELDFIWVATGGVFSGSNRDTLADLFQDSVTVAWTAPGEEGIYDLFVEVSDGQSIEIAMSQVQVSVTQKQPVASAGQDLLLAYEDSLQIVLDGSGSRDADGDDLNYSWVQLQAGGPNVRLRDSGGPQPSFFMVGPAPADYIFVLSVRDDVVTPTGALTSEPDTVVIRVSDRAGRSN